MIVLFLTWRLTLQDQRAVAFDQRRQCYDLIFNILSSSDNVLTNMSPSAVMSDRLAAFCEFVCCFLNEKRWIYFNFCHFDSIPFFPHILTFFFLSPLAHFLITAPDELEAFQNNLYEVALSSEDELFHYCLYEWLVQQNMIERLLKIRRPFLETYLQREKHNLEKADLLWQLYVKMEQFGKAAQVLSDLADSSE